ncbi:unnamed protein product [Schistosoma turkestanicum]|nr:unnamed protein product [Schistosoma turkestanicum]
MSYSSIPDNSNGFLSKSLTFEANQSITSKLSSQSRLGSLLNVAASLASRPAWKSQDTLGVMNDDSDNDSNHSMTHIQPRLRKGKITRIPSDGLIDPTIHSSAQFSRRYSFCPTKKRSRLSFSINGRHNIFGNETIESSTSSLTTKCPLFVLNHEESFVMIKPGLNKFSFIANVSTGILIPEQIFLNCLDEIVTELKEALREQQSMKSTMNNYSEINFVSFIDDDVYGSSWRDTELMKTLLPKPEIAVSNNASNKHHPVVFGTCQPIPVRLKLGKLGLPEDCKLSTSLYRIRSNDKKLVVKNKAENTQLNATQTTLIKPHNNNNESENLSNNNGYPTVASGYGMSSQFRANDYSLISNSLENYQDENSLIKHHNLFSQFILEDGPVDFIREFTPSTTIRDSSCKVNHSMPTFPPGCCLQLSRPLYLSATSSNDQFALSMPSGHYCILPVEVIKPLEFNLNIYPLPNKTYTIISLNITCVDADPDSNITPEIYCNQNIHCNEPITYELSNMRFYVCALKPHVSRRPALRNSFTNGQNQLYNRRQLKSRSSPTVEDYHQISEDFTKNNILETGTTDKLCSTVNETIESLAGYLLDNRITKAYVNHLTPFSIPWRFKSLEYNNFMKMCKESNCQPIGRFECTMNRIGSVSKLNQEIRADCVIGKQM